MSLIVWIVLGLISGFIASKLVNNSQLISSTDMTKLYPKGTIRRIVKAHEPQHKLSKSADVLV